MKVLLRKDIEKLGIVGDVVEVTAGFARNHLFPSHLATTPTKGNMRSLATERAAAEERRRLAIELLKRAAEKLEGVEVTISAAANEDGVLYGSVGARDIAEALAAEGHPVRSEHVKLEAPIRHLDNATVDLKLADDISATVKVWVVREKAEGEEDVAEENAVMEAGADEQNQE